MTASGSLNDWRVYEEDKAITDISYTSASRYEAPGSFPLFCPACEAALLGGAQNKAPLPVSVRLAKTA